VKWLAVIGICVAGGLAAAGAFVLAGDSSGEPSAYRPPRLQTPVLEDSLSITSCANAMRGTILAICDPTLFKRSYETGRLRRRGDMRVAVSGRRVRVGSTPYLTQVSPDDGSGLGLVPGSKVTLSGRASAGSYIYLRASSLRPGYVAYGEALFTRLGLDHGGKATIRVRLENGRLRYDFRRPDGSMLTPVRATLVAGPGPRGKLPPLPAHYADTPQQAVKTYVAAINAHDGKTICRLFLPSVEAQLVARHDPCWLVVRGHIGYGEEGSTPLFQHATLDRIGKSYTRESEGIAFTALPIDVRLRYRSQRYSSTFRKIELHDIAWFERTDAGWRLAKPSESLYASFSGNVPADVLDVPAPAAALRRHEAEVNQEQEQAQRMRQARRRAERATLVHPRRGRVPCHGKLAVVEDPVGDVEQTSPPKPAQRRAAARLARHADLVSVRVAVAGRDVCLGMTFREAPVYELASLFLFLKRPRSPVVETIFELGWVQGRLHAGTGFGPPELETPAHARVAVDGSTVWASFELPAEMPALRPRDLEFVRWALTVNAALRSPSSRPILLDQEYVPEHVPTSPLAVRQSDARIVKIR